jgi:hypothetical protein
MVTAIDWFTCRFCREWQSGQPLRQLRQKAIAVLRTVVYSHDGDPRQPEEQDSRQIHYQRMKLKPDEPPGTIDELIAKDIS